MLRFVAKKIQPLSFNNAFAYWNHKGREVGLRNFSLYSSVLSVVKRIWLLKNLTTKYAEYHRGFLSVYFPVPPVFFVVK
jgi:hypothetical protein